MIPLPVAPVPLVPMPTAPAAEAVARVGSDPAFRQACARLLRWERWVQQRQLELSSIAAPTGFEALRAEWMARQLRALHWQVRFDRAGNVLASWPGTQPRRAALAVTAHLDTAFPPGTRVQVERRGSRLHGPGICDNGAGLAALLALARCVCESALSPRIPLLFVANVGEEGEGDLKGMRYLFRPGGVWARRIAWTIVLDGPGVEQITAAALPSLRARVVLQGPGGHSWSDLGRASALHAALRVGAALLAQVRPQAGEVGCNIGCARGGSAVNAIASSAELKIDLRARDPLRLRQLEQALGRALAAGLEQENAAALSGLVTGRIEIIGARPGGQLAPDAPLLCLVRQVDAALGIAAQSQCASTDANIPIAQGRQALRLGAGGAAAGIHTLREWFDPAGRTLALQRLWWLISALADFHPAAR